MALRFHSAASRNLAGEGAGAGPAGLRSPRIPCLGNDLVRGAGPCLCVACSLEGSVLLYRHCDTVQYRGGLF